MQAQIKIFLTIFVLICSTSLVAKTSEEYLVGKISEHNHRYQTFKTALDLMQKRGVKIIVETGTSRDGLKNFEGDGGSSIIFSQYATDHDAQFFSVDMDQSALNNASIAVQEVLGKLDSKLHFIKSDSIVFLKNFPVAIDFLYLDSYDYDVNNPNASQNHHLLEIKAAYPHLTPQSIVMIDDCGLPHGGKGRLVISYLLGKGWKILENKYQTILIKQE